MNEVAYNMAWAVVFSALGGLIGIALILAASVFLPRFIERLTPNIDEDKEIARGNVAVANYFGRVVGASIIGSASSSPRPSWAESSPPCIDGAGTGGPGKFRASL